MPKVSIITPSVREKGLDVVRESLCYQTYTDWEWIVCSPFEIKDALWTQDNFHGGFWGLNRAYNALFKKSHGEIIISWQDYIWLPPEALNKMVNAVERTGGIVSGVGDQYQRLNEDTGKPEVKLWSDPRKTNKYGDFYECHPNDVEWNWAGMPREVPFSVGGFDEKLDFLGFGGDQLQFMERADELGYKSFLDQSNESFTLRHDRSFFGGEKNWNNHHVLFSLEQGISKYDQRKKELKDRGNWPVLTYI